MVISLSVLLRMRNVSDKICRKNRNTHFVFNNYFPKIVPVYEIMWKKCCTTGQATDDNTAQAHSTLDT